jgi:broad specificity phosphatase PhoE
LVRFVVTMKVVTMKEVHVRLLLVRHGATANNLEARFTGQSDIPLSALGERQARAAADALARTPLDAVISSDLRRAWATAVVIARPHGLTPETDPDLREIGMGAWEGQAASEIEAADLELITSWRRDPLRHAPPGGEALADLQARMVSALVRWQERFPQGTLLWVTHGGSIGALLCHLLGMDLARREQFRRDNASITELDLSGPLAVITRLNDTTHLTGLASDDAIERFQVM